MIRKQAYWMISAVFCCLLSASIMWADDEAASGSSAEVTPKQVRDVLWVWANPDMATPGEHTAASFASAGSAERARILGVPNVAP